MTDAELFETIEQQEAREHAQRAAVMREEDKRAALVEFMNSYGGRLFMWDLLTAAGLWRSSYLGGDREDTFFREGERNVALRIMAQLREHCPTLALKMQEENTR